MPVFVFDDYGVLSFIFRVECVHLVRLSVLFLSVVFFHSISLSHCLCLLQLLLCSTWPLGFSAGFLKLWLLVCESCFNATKTSLVSVYVH